MNFYQTLFLLLCVAGFHGVFFYRNLAFKIFSWCLFQAGLVLFLVRLAFQDGPLPMALAIQVAAVTLGVALPLGAWALKLHRRYKTWDSREIGGKRTP